MKETKPTQHKKSVFSSIDGWNFGIGLWASLVVFFVIIIPLFLVLLWMCILIFGGLLGIA